MNRILIVFGTRPEAIKMAPLVKSFEKHTQFFEVAVCVTAQHREMLDQVLNLFDIKPEFDLNIMRHGQDLYDITTKVITDIKAVLLGFKPDIVLVHGDTTTSMAAALAAFYQQIPVGHIEAGLRTNNILSPWPEEMNRQITGRIATYHFAPTEISKQNLLKENISIENIIVTGNTVIDALLNVVSRIRSNQQIQEELKSNILHLGYDMSRLKLRKMVLITGHRRENFGKGFLDICNAIKHLSEKHEDVDFIYPMHLNPNVREPINQIFGENKHQNIFFIEPLDYLPFVYLMEKCTIVMTDSGGIQEEAPGLGKPVLVMRNTTERPEALKAGTVELVGTDFNTIVSKVSRLLIDKQHYQKMSEANNPYGDGLASERIISFIKEKI